MIQVLSVVWQRFLQGTGPDAIPKCLWWMAHGVQNSPGCCGPGSQLTYLQAHPSCVSGPAIRVPLGAIPWHKSISCTHAGPPHSSAICLNATQTSTTPNFQKGHLSIDLGKNFLLKAPFLGKNGFLSQICFPIFTHYRNSDACWEEECLKSKMCSLQFDF